MVVMKISFLALKNPVIKINKNIWKDFINLKIRFQLVNNKNFKFKKQGSNNLSRQIHLILNPKVIITIAIEQNF